MKRVFETAECEAVRNSIFWELRYEKHENQMKGSTLLPRYTGLSFLSFVGRLLTYKSYFFPCLLLHLSALVNNN